MFKKLTLLSALAVSLFAAVPNADAGIVFGRIAPVRRVAYRTALPPYPVARTVVARPVVGYPLMYGAPVYRGPMIYGPGFGIAF